MKALTLWAIIIATTAVYGDKIYASIKKSKPDVFMTEDKAEISATQAAKVLITNPKAKVYRCAEVELSEKLTLRKKK